MIGIQIRQHWLFLSKKTSLIFIQSFRVNLNSFRILNQDIKCNKL
jgi:hypothetical protein